MVLVETPSTYHPMLLLMMIRHFVRRRVIRFDAQFPILTLGNILCKHKSPHILVEIDSTRTLK